MVRFEDIDDYDGVYGPGEDDSFEDLLHPDWPDDDEDDDIELTDEELEEIQRYAEGLDDDDLD